MNPDYQASFWVTEQQDRYSECGKPRLGQAFDLDEVAQGRPAPFMIFRVMEKTGVVDVRRVAVVGDTTLDLEAGWNAGVGQIIGVLSGAHGIDRLNKAPHTNIVGSVADLPGLWGRST